MHVARARWPRIRHSATLRPSREVGAARIRYLDRDKCRRLVTASPEPLRPIVHGVMLTGLALANLPGARRRFDFHRDSGKVVVRTSKAGKVGGGTTYRQLGADSRHSSSSEQ